MGTEPCVIVSLDKDLHTIPGLHFNFVTNTFSEVTEQQGWINFYTQLIMGDRADNIPGYDGKMRQKVPQFLQPIVDKVIEAESYYEMFQVVEDLYDSQGLGVERMHINAQLLYILRTNDDKFVPPN
jgi:hypothetical protein